MKNIITITLMLVLASGFVYFYKKSQNLQKQNIELEQAFDNLSTQILVENEY